MNTTAYDVLKAQCSQEWDSTIHHRFVNELVSDTLPDEILRHYLIQDWQFSYDFYSLLGEAIAAADTMPAKVRLGQQMGFIANDENTYFHDRFVQFHVSDDELTAPELTPSSKGFRKLYRDAVDSHSYAQALAVLVVAESIYLDWAEESTAGGSRMPEKDQHIGWIDVHRGNDFSAWVQFLIDEFNRVADPQDSEVARHFTDAVHFELGFFDDAYIHE
ncbi:TenA family protein [Bifidobacterium sp.]|jgi:thiaminase/transcriptional activator TenA|uniref:TenA family protein n=1 Tax=Bifidobacterium sp. TaxID=41200 RepID=UPI0025BDD9C2|nr:TenA family protein [Bifidobacterium sp.]MCI1635758.1 TenA family protein [Bifidobacterium sp.]